MEQLAILKNWEKAKLAVRECANIDEAKDIRDKAQALKIYAQQARESLEVQNNIAEIKIRAERRIGEFSRELETQQGFAHTHHDGENVTKTQILQDAGISPPHASRYEAIANIPEEKFEEVITNTKASQEELTTAAMLRVAKDKPHVSHNSGENEWYTPLNIISLAKAVMGYIDTDPASSAQANKIVQAKQYYTIDDDGLNKVWQGNVWMNPPYAQPLISRFSETITNKYVDGEIEQAIILVNNATETQWFQTMLSVASAVCFPLGRIKFIDVEGNPSGAPLQGQALIYCGTKTELFLKEFSSIGIVLINA